MVTGIGVVDWLATTVGTMRMAAWGVGVAGILTLVFLVLLAQLVRAQRSMLRAGRRMDQLTSALELLTDTTEAGFVNVASALERLGKLQLATTSGRKATTRRIVHATRRGQSVEAIAAAEGVSESEIGLHLGLEAAARRARAADDGDDADDDLRSDVAGGAVDAPPASFDPTQWTVTLRRRETPSRGAQHAALRV